MSVEPIFEPKFGCDMRYKGSIDPMYTITYDLLSLEFVNDDSLPSDNDNSTLIDPNSNSTIANNMTSTSSETPKNWIRRFSNTLEIFPEQIEEMRMKTLEGGTLLDINHLLEGFGFLQSMDKDMLTTYSLVKGLVGDDDGVYYPFFEGFRSEQRPFEYLTWEWKGESSCQGILGSQLKEQTFSRMGYSNLFEPSSFEGRKRLNDTLEASIGFSTFSNRHIVYPRE